MAKRKLPKSWTTVTLFSKYLTMILFIVLPFVGFYLGMQYQDLVTPDYPPTQYIASPAMKKVVPMKNRVISNGQSCSITKHCTAGYDCLLDGTNPTAEGTCVKPLNTAK